MKLTIEPGVRFGEGLDELAGHLRDSRLAAEEVHFQVARVGRRIEVALVVVAIAVFALALALKARAEVARCPTS